jgi:hypothetical protein
VRRTLFSVAIGLVGAACVTASGWALQAAALTPPEPADHVAANASAWFHEHRLVVDVFHLDHRRLKGACLRGWFPGPNGQKTRASLLSLTPGPVVRVADDRRLALAVERPGRRVPARILASAGCSVQLAPALAAAAQGSARLTTERSYAANQPAIALEVERGTKERLTLYVSPRTDEPLVAIVARDGREVTARLFLSNVRRHLLARFHLLRLAEPARRR